MCLSIAGDGLVCYLVASAAHSIATKAAPTDLIADTGQGGKS
jgi:hypothetical protein